MPPGEDERVPRQQSAHRRSGDNIDSSVDFSYNGGGSVLLVLTYPQTLEVAYLAVC
jgi:hypothetical protein